jgi:hypothetical protein
MSTNTYSAHPETISTVKSGFLSDDQLLKLEQALDNRFSFLGFRFGLDGLIGLIPGIGDLATGAISSVIIADSWKRGVRKRTLLRMIWNTLLDSTIGAIPLVGDLFDFAFRSNVKNIRLLRADMARKQRLS